MSIARKHAPCIVREVEASAQGTRALVVVSGGEQDRDGEFVHPEGGKTLPGIQLLYGHNWSELDANIGVVESGEMLGKEYVNRVRFDDNIPEHRSAIIAAKKAKNGTLNTVSIGFEPHVVKKPDGRVVTLSRGEWVYSEPGQHHLEWSQLELSFVPVPSYPGTGVLSVRNLEGPEGKALETAIRKALETILGSDEFLARLRASKSGGDGAAVHAVDPVSAAPAAAVGDPLDLNLEDFLAKNPLAAVLTSDNPEQVARALAAAGGGLAEDDLESFFSAELAPVGAPGA